ncbi:MAG: GGDEF domain-containing protein [Gemmobacter sp.]|uniref:GGDEF domain-containing protein n=1 Tax=Gemmobacter sp. TaxID=1898957 RepID=UPI001A408C16|nr:GGDEF domain-containing protein [Gemmobacter sp.]
MATRMIDPAALRQYRQQIAAGFLLLRFEPGIEKDYASETRDRLRGAAQICGALSLAVWLGFAGLDVLRVQQLPPGIVTHGELLLWFGARWLVVALIVLGLVAARRRWPAYPWLAWLSYVALGLSAGFTGHLARLNGSFSADSSVIVIVMAAWLPMGFLFWRALCAALIVALTSMLITMLAHDPRPLSERLQVTVMLLLAVPLAGAGGYLREYADRRQYLLASLRYRESMTDSLTGLPNRRHLYCEAEIWLARQAQDGKSWAMGVLDLDRFKAFNDRFGHQAGDDALQQVAEALTGALAARGAFAARLGGEEFCLLVPGTPAQAGAIAAAAQAAILALALPHPDSPNRVLSASVGLASARPGTSFDTLLRAADRALYAAKSSQRGSLYWADVAEADDLEMVGGEGLEPPTFSV